MECEAVEVWGGTQGRSEKWGDEGIRVGSGGLGVTFG